MMRSLYAGVSGLRNHQTRMDVIGNNIANVNTVGFKRGRVNFQDTLYQTMRGAAAPGNGRGGINPAQVGLGVGMASIDTIQTQGSLQNTGKNTDVSLQGDGFFVLSDGAGQVYTRAGTFDLDNDGNLINTANGMKVQGWNADITGNIDTSSQTALSDINIPIGQSMQPVTTKSITFANNLDASAQAGVTSPYDAPIEVYDSEGNPHRIITEFTKDATPPNQWSYEVKLDLSDPLIKNQLDALVPAFDSLTAAQKETAINNAQNNVLAVAPNVRTGKIVFNSDGTFDAAGTQTANSVTAPNLTEPISFQPVGTDPVEIMPDFSALTQYAADSSVAALKQDGNPTGTLQSFTIDPTGTITGIFSNGFTKNLAALAVANFNNPGGLMKEGENLYKRTNNSGEPQTGLANTGGRGAITAGALEMSNVDLAQEFTDMITAQRGFQANSRVITTSDEMLQELVNLKR